MSLWKDNTARQTPAPTSETREPTRFDAPSKPELAQPCFSLGRLAMADSTMRDADTNDSACLQAPAKHDVVESVAANPFEVVAKPFVR